MAEVYRAYAAFRDLAADMGRDDLAHRLVLCEPLSIAGEAPLFAASIASAGSLTVEPVGSAVRRGTRSGAIDFDVNTLDEALRSLKNELRKGLSIAVCLEGDPAAVLAEMAERGVQPDAICASRGDVSPLLGPFVARGARVLDPLSLDEKMPRRDGRRDTFWSVSSLPGTWLTRLDGLVASLLPEDDHNRRSWLKRAPRYLGRPLRTERYLPMHPDEFARFLRAVRESAAAEAWDVAVTLRHAEHDREVVETRRVEARK